MRSKLAAARHRGHDAGGRRTRPRPRITPGPAVPRPGDRPDRDDLRGDDGRRPVLDHVRLEARRLLRGLRRRELDPLQPVRFYTVGLDVRDGRLADGDVRFKDVTTLLAPGGLPYAPFSLDPEGLALTKDRELIFTSEGIANSLIDPFIRRYSLDGSFLADLLVPQAFRVTADQSSGVRQNLGFESAGAQRPRPLRRGRERALPGRPARDRVGRQPRTHPALRPAQRPARAPVDLHHRPRRAAAGAADPVLGQRRSSSYCRSTTTP